MAGLQVKGLRCLELLFDTEPNPIFFLGANIPWPRCQPFQLGPQSPKLLDFLGKND